MNPDPAVDFRFDLVGAEVAIGDSDANPILVAGGNERHVNQTCMKIEGNSIVMAWREGDQADEIKALFAQPGIRFRNSARKALVAADGFSLELLRARRWRLIRRRCAVWHLVGLPLKGEPSVVRLVADERLVLDTKVDTTRRVTARTFGRSDLRSEARFREEIQAVQVGSRPVSLKSRDRGWKASARPELNVLIKNLLPGRTMKKSLGFCQPPDTVRKSPTPKS